MLQCKTVNVQRISVELLSFVARSFDTVLEEWMAFVMDIVGHRQNDVIRYYCGYKVSRAFLGHDSVAIENCHSKETNIENKYGKSIKISFWYFQNLTIDISRSLCNKYSGKFGGSRDPYADRYCLRISKAKSCENETDRTT